MLGSKQTGFLLFEVLISGLILSILMSSMLFFFKQIRSKQQAILTLEQNLYRADAQLAQAFAGESLDPERTAAHAFGGGLRLIEIPIGETSQALWVVVP